MDLISLTLPLLYLLLVLGLFTFLLIRGVTHLFIALFAAGALIQVIPRLSFLAMHQAPGGFSANVRYLPILSALGMIGTLCFAAGFFALTIFLLRSAKPSA